VAGVSRTEMSMASVPAGTYWVGSPDSLLEQMVSLCLMGTAESTCRNTLYSDQIPAHTVQISGFWMDETEVSNAQYAQCVNAGRCVPSKFAGEKDFGNWDQPVTGISWHSAIGYCQWRGRTLPTEAQWEYAARRGHGARYAWGDAPPDPHKARYCDDQCKAARFAVKGGVKAPRGPEPVNSNYGSRTTDGLYHMSGNVREWVLDTYDEDFYQTISHGTRNPLKFTQAPRQEKCHRGGGWDDPPTHLDVTIRRADKPETLSNSLGFRCAASSSGQGMAHIPGGTFSRGIHEYELEGLVRDCSLDDGKKKCEYRFRFGDQTPYHKATLSAYEIDRFPVTNSMYKKCLTEGPCRTAGSTGSYGLDEDDLPVTMVSWDDASTFCQFAGKRLCTETEREVAATGGEGKAPYPWGTSQISSAHAWYLDPFAPYVPPDARKEDDSLKPMPVLSWALNVSPFGVYDMVGNIEEWTADRYDSKAYKKCEKKCVDPVQRVKAKKEKISVRGGAYSHGPSKVTAQYRAIRYRNLTLRTIGFRCCR